MTIFPARINKERGFTLLEILVALAIIGVIMGLAVGQIGKMVSRNIKSSARTLASTIQYLYNEAASEGVTLRLVLNLDEANYKVERRSESFTMKKDEENPEAGFSLETARLLKPVKLPKGVFFKDVFTEHQTEPVNAGIAYIHFFPQGTVERSVINLKDQDDKLHVSLEINPFSGAVKMSNEYKEMESK